MSDSPPLIKVHDIVVISTSLTGAKIQHRKYNRGKFCNLHHDTLNVSQRSRHEQNADKFSSLPIEMRQARKHMAHVSECGQTQTIP